MPSRNERRQERYGKRNDRIRLSMQTNWKKHTQNNKSLHIINY